MKPHILLGLTGSVAAIKGENLIKSMMQIGDVRAVTTKAGKYFLDQTNKQNTDFWERAGTGTLAIQPGSSLAHCQSNIYTDNQEWPDEYALGDSVLHIELRRWASCLVIAPLGANTLAKIALGLCDNLLTCIVRAWDWTRPMFIAPAMNTMMWENEPTREHIDIMKKRGAIVIEPVEKRLACNDVGMGAMASIDEIIQLVEQRLRWLFPLKNCNGVPINHHPGAFGFHRRKNHHTGVDLYCRDGESVYAVEDGIVVKVDYFTGPKVGHEWWEETWGVMIEGASGVVNYGEVTPIEGIQVGQTIKRGSQVGNVKRVLFADKHRPDIPGHSTSMLHLEFYQHGTRDFADWHTPSKNPTLLDATPYLLNAVDAPIKTLTWDNSEERTVG